MKNEKNNVDIHITKQPFNAFKNIWQSFIIFQIYNKSQEVLQHSLIHVNSLLCNIFCFFMSFYSVYFNMLALVLLSVTLCRMFPLIFLC